MSRWSLIGLLGLAIGGTTSVWLIPGQLDLSFLLGFIVTYVTIEIASMSERPESMLYNPQGKLAPTLSVGTERGIAIALALIAGITVCLLYYSGVIGWAPPGLASFSYFACGTLAGVAFFMFVNARRKARQMATEMPSTEEVSR